MAYGNIRQVAIYKNGTLVAYQYVDEQGNVVPKEIVAQFCACSSATDQCCTQWEQAFGCDLDTSDCVWWIQGIDCSGALVYPNGTGPEYYACLPVGVTNQVDNNSYSFGNATFDLALSGTGTSNGQFVQGNAGTVYLPTAIVNEINTWLLAGYIVVFDTLGANHFRVVLGGPGWDGNLLVDGAAFTINMDYTNFGTVALNEVQALYAQAVDGGQVNNLLGTATAYEVVQTNDGSTPLDPQPTNVSLEDCLTTTTTIDPDCCTEFELASRCGFDDVNGDGSAYVSYTEMFRICCDASGNLTSTQIGTFTDDTMETAYTPVNPVDIDTVGDDLGVLPRRIYLNAATTFAIPALTQSFTIKTRTVGDINNPPTVTDSSGNTTPLFEGETDTFGVVSGQHILISPFTINVNAGDEIIVNLVELSAV